MDLTSRVLHDAEFREAKRGGYNTQDVDEFLERLAVAVDRQDAALREARQRVAAAEHRAAEVERRLEEAARGPGDSDETLKRTLVLAQRTADAAIREAEERAARLVAAAEDEAARLLAEAQEATAQAHADAEEEARRAQHAARTRVLAELQELEATREILRGDVELLERHIEEQRDRLRGAIRELQVIVDDPAALREVAVPDLTPVEIPDPEPARPVTAHPDPRPEPRPEARPERHGRLVAPRAASSEPVPEDAYGPVDAPGPSGRGSVRPDPRPLLADARPVVHQDEEEDEYLAELRQAMHDDQPLGPRDEADDEAPPPRSRFGRRR